MFRLWAVTATFVVIHGITIPVAVGQQNAQSDVERVLSDWKQVDELDKQERSYVELLSRPDMPSFKPRRSVIKIRPDAWLTFTEHNGEKSVVIKSPRYDLILISPPGLNGYTIRAMQQPDDTGRPEFINATISLRTCRPLGTLFTGRNSKEPRDRTLHEVAQRPDFKISRITTERPGIDRVSFAYTDASGWLLTDRANSSVVLESEIRFGTQTATTYPTVYAMKRSVEQSGAELYCTLIDYTIRHGVTGKLIRHERMEFSDYKPGPVDEGEFLLTHYDIPEPHGVEVRKRIPTYVWLLVAAATFGLLAVAIRFSAKRRVRAGGGAEV